MTKRFLSFHDHPPAHRLGQIFTWAAKLSLTLDNGKKKKKETERKKDRHTAHIHSSPLQVKADKLLQGVMKDSGLIVPSLEEKKQQQISLGSNTPDKE